MGKKAKRGIIRYCCPSCKKTYSYPKKKTWKKTSALFWFEKYILGRMTYDQLVSRSDYSIIKLEYIFHQLLSEPPPTIDIPELTREEAYLLVDGL